jgi:hypothetical protein
MRPLPAASIFAAVMASVAVAQTAQQSYAPPQQSPSQPSAPADPAANARKAHNDSQGDINDCTSQVKANNPRLSAVEVKEYCQRDLNPTSPQDQKNLNPTSPQD